ncbi:MAG: AsmA family protein [Rhodanobacteraceae bacterium]
MSAIGAVRAHPWRWIIAAILVLLLIALLVGALIVRSLLQPQRFTALLQDQLAGVELVLSVDKPAAPALWPHPAVQLEGFRLSNAGASTPLLQASKARIVVPWHALLHREIAIERLEIETPRIDLDQLQALLARLPGNAGAPRLPRIGAGIKLVNGTLVRSDAPLLVDVNAETGPLLVGTPFRLDFSARDSDDRGGALALRTLPLRKADALHFEDTGIGVSIEKGPRAQVSGDVVWRGGADIEAALRGNLTIPAPAEVGKNTAPRAKASSGKAAVPEPVPIRDYALMLDIAPSRGALPLMIAVKLDGANEHVDARLSPSESIDWWNRLLAAAPDTPVALPPVRGSARIGQLDFGALHLQGVRIEAGSDVAPPDTDATTATGKQNQNGKPAAPGHR